MKYKVYANGKLIAEFKYKFHRDNFLDDFKEKYINSTFTTKELELRKGNG